MEHKVTAQIREWLDLNLQHVSQLVQVFAVRPGVYQSSPDILRKGLEDCTGHHNVSILCLIKRARVWTRLLLCEPVL